MNKKNYVTPSTTVFSIELPVLLAGTKDGINAITEDSEGTAEIQTDGSTMDTTDDNGSFQSAGYGCLWE